MSEKKTSNNLIEYLRSLNDKTGDLSEPYTHEQFEKIYPRVPVDICMARSPDVVLWLNDVNTRWQYISNKHHYQYLYYALSKKKRFAKSDKVEKDLENLEILQTIYQVSSRRAQEMLKMCSQDDLKAMRDHITTGGIENKE